MSEEQQMSKEEQIGFHKGAISVLNKEREEMVKIANITEQLIQLHLKQLEELGVDTSSVKEESEKTEESPKPKKKIPIENLI
ncbi:MAG: hypothetical protein ACMXYA_01650 [Candidatus Woesearchaeota archaeon]